MENILTVFLYSCPACLGKTLPDYIKDLADLNRKVDLVTELDNRRDTYLKDNLDSIQNSVAAFRSALENRVAAIEAKTDTILHSLGENRASCSNAIHVLDEKLELISDKIETLSAQRSNLAPPSQLPDIFTKLSTLEPARLSLEEKLSEMCEKLYTLETSFLADRPSMPPATPKPACEADYPSPNEATSDGGVWMAIGTSRFWTCDLTSLKALRNREKAKLRRQIRRRERRREGGLRKRQTSQPSQPAIRRPQVISANQEHQNQQPSLEHQPTHTQSQLRASSPRNQSQRPAAHRQQASGCQAPDHESQDHTQQGSQSQAPEQRQASSSGSVQTAQTVDEIPLRMHTPNKETWIYISRVANDVTVADLKDYISRKLHRQDIECHLLLGKNIDPRSRQSISFKARIPSSCAYIALHSSFWPTGVNARYFVSAKDF